MKYAVKSLMILACVAAAVCAQESPSPPIDDGKPHVLLSSEDTTYEYMGFPEITSPFDRKKDSFYTLRLTAERFESPDKRYRQMRVYIKDPRAGSSTVGPLDERRYPAFSGAVANAVRTARSWGGRGWPNGPQTATFLADGAACQLRIWSVAHQPLMWEIAGGTPRTAGFVGMGLPELERLQQQAGQIAAWLDKPFLPKAKAPAGKPRA